jgi:hypothetical protein
MHTQWQSTPDTRVESDENTGCALRRSEGWCAVQLAFLFTEASATSFHWFVVVVTVTTN